MLLEDHQFNNVKVHTNVRLTGLKADAEGNVTHVELSDGRSIETQLVLIGAGVKPATAFLKDSGLDMESDGGLKLDPFLQTNDKNIFAAGDIASYPYWPTGKHQRSEHWITALDQGSFAAFNMLGKMVPYGSIPFFWTRHYNKAL